MKLKAIGVAFFCFSGYAATACHQSAGAPLLFLACNFVSMLAFHLFVPAFIPSSSSSSCSCSDFLSSFHSRPGSVLVWTRNGRHDAQLVLFRLVLTNWCTGYWCWYPAGWIKTCCNSFSLNVWEKWGRFLASSTSQEKGKKPQRKSQPSLALRFLHTFPRFSHTSTSTVY